MRRALLLAIMVLVPTLPVQAADVNVDYDRDIDFSKYKSFSYKPSDDGLAQSNQLMDGRIEDGIKQHLKESGVNETDSNPDVYVTYHVQSQDKRQFTTTGFGYAGGGPGMRRWGGAGMGSTTTHATDYTEGTLIIDAWDAGTKKMIWRGTSSQVLKEKPEKQEKQMDKALDKMWQKWEKLRAGEKG